MDNWIDKVTYGNPTLDHISLVKKSCLADEVIPVLDRKFKNSLVVAGNFSSTTKDELNHIKKQVELLQLDTNKEHLLRFKRYDKSLSQTISSSFTAKGIDVDKIIDDVNEDILPLIAKLKFKYQRPRPYQLSQYYKLSLFPFNSVSAHTPSFPSGHTIQAFVILNIIGSKHPQTYSYCKKMIDDVALSRVMMGLHYPSDNDASYLIGGEILKLRSFTDKYKI